MFDTWLTPLWEQVEPSAVVEAHRASVPLTAARVFGESVDVERLVRLGVLLTDIVARLDTAGRPFAAANQALATPAEPWAKFWHACNTLREYRGDGHIAALVAADLDVIEAQLLTCAWARRDIDVELLRKTRQYTEAEWVDGQLRLADRGLLAQGGALTPAGRALREDIEARTNRASMRPWNLLSAADCADTYEFLADLSEQLIRSGDMRAVTTIGAPWPPPALEPDD